MALDKNQICSQKPGVSLVPTYTPTQARCSHFPACTCKAKASWSQALVPPRLEGCEELPASGKPWLSIKVSWLFFPCLCLSSTASSLTPHSSRPLVLEFFQPKSTQALMFCPGFSGPSLSHSSCDPSNSILARTSGNKASPQLFPSG